MLLVNTVPPVPLCSEALFYPHPPLCLALCAPTPPPPYPPPPPARSPSRSPPHILLIPPSLLHTLALLTLVPIQFPLSAMSFRTFVTKIRKRECLFRVLHLGGTIRSCQKVLLAYNREQLTLLLEKATTPVEKRKIEGMILATSKDSFHSRH